MAIPRTTETNFHVGDVLEDIPMGMRAEDFVYIASLFENLYSRPIEAIIREYATNGWDSHVFAGNTRPIEITLPTPEDLHFTVQDFGLGMNVDTLRNVYSMYGYSDKRETNAVAGQLGMGSKSGLSYATGFGIVAVKGGVKVSAFSTKDEHGLGVIKVLDTCGTDEPNGVRIKIPVERYDVDTFRHYATNLFQFWAPGTVLIDGEAPPVPDWRSTALSLDSDDHTLLVRKDSGLDSSYVIMGNVPYPVDDADMGRGISHRFVAQLNIGDVDFAPSREDVRHTTHTDKTLAALNDYVKASYRRAIDRHLATATTRWEETMLRTLWMDRNVTIRSSKGDPIWAYTPQGWSHRKAAAHTSYRVANLATPKTIVVTGFEAKMLSTQARQRMLDFAQGWGITVDRSTTFLVFPSSAPTGLLDGRPNTFAWADIVGTTTVPKAVRAKQIKTETRYNIHGSPTTMTADDLSKVKGKVLYLVGGDYAYKGDLGATIVMLRTVRQIDRLLRFVPKAVPYVEEVERQSKIALKAITQQDRDITQARTLPALYKELDPAKVSDPELAKFIRLCKTPDTATMMKARTFGHSIKAKSIRPIFEKRYPLLHRPGYYNSDMTVSTAAQKADLLMYINTKYDALAATMTTVAVAS